MQVSHEPEDWAIILAGGEGSRLSPLIRRLAGRDIPKQFFPVLGGTTLFDRTRDRVERAIRRERIISVVTGHHERYYAKPLENDPEFNVVVQPQNRGTAPAILYALCRIARVAPKAFVSIFPSDHYFGNERRFLSYVEKALHAARARPDVMFVMGVPASTPETSYGWIECAGPVIGCSPCFRAINRFWEKPDREFAVQLLARGCLWNTFIVVASAATLLAAYATGLPTVYRDFVRIQRLFGTMFEKAAAERVYRDTQVFGFSEAILASCRFKLATIAMDGVEWTDLGEPQRVLAVLSRNSLSRSA